MRIRRAVLGCFLSALGAIPIALASAPAMAREVMTWNLRGATYTNPNGQASQPMWPVVFDTMINENKELAAIQEAGNFDEISQQIRNLEGAQIRTRETGLTVPTVAASSSSARGQLARVNVSLIEFEFRGEVYRIYVLNSDTQESGKQIALVLRGQAILGNVPRGSLPSESIRIGSGGLVLVLTDARRAALGVTVNDGGGGTTYFSVHANANNQDPTTIQTLLTLDEAVSDNSLSSRWVALGDWNTDISTPSGVNFFDRQAIRAEPSIRIHVPDALTFSATEPNRRNTLDYAFSNYPFIQSQGRVIDEIQSQGFTFVPGGRRSFPSDHLPVNYEDGPSGDDDDDNSPSPPPFPPSAPDSGGESDGELDSETESLLDAVCNNPVFLVPEACTNR